MLNKTKKFTRLMKITMDDCMEDKNEIEFQQDHGKLFVDE